ncbi:hypothetical protein ACFYU9_05510 [Streptomyces sp. NPDC004327]|uniref:Mu transposase domain-containing protein n=1 Tax=Streptomyces sp. NPDC004327 TaxID=3364699 RepID=UPI003677A302
MPFEEFDVGLTLTPKVDKTSRITIRQNKYSVPARFIGQNVRVSLRADEVWVFDRHKIVVRHPRARSGRSLGEGLGRNLPAKNVGPSAASPPGVSGRHVGDDPAGRPGRSRPAHAFPRPSSPSRR